MDLISLKLMLTKYPVNTDKSSYVVYTGELKIINLEDYIKTNE